MKKTISAMLAIALLLPMALSFGGCAIMTKGSAYCERFLERIVAGEYGDAWDMLPETIKKVDPNEVRATPTPTPTPVPTATPVPEEGAEEEKDPDEMEYPDIVEPTMPPEPTPILPLEPVITENPDVTGTASRNPGEDPAVDLGSVENGHTPMPAETPEPKATRTPKPTPTPAPSPTPQLDEDGNPIIEKTITRAEFIDKYTSIFEELQLTGIDYTITDVLNGDILSQLNYTLTYHSGRGGDLTYDFTIQANRIEYKWTINWSPSLIFPMMDWGDNVRVGVLQANRGEILCDGVPYAQNVNILTIFAVPSSVVAYRIEEAKKAGMTDEELPTTEEIYEDFAREVCRIPELGLTEEAVLKALSRARNDFSKLKTFYPDQMNEDLMNRILSIKGLAVDANNYGTQRYYPMGSSLCHIVGYAGIITKQKKLYYERIVEDTESYSAAERALAAKYNGDSWVGNYGLEYVYEETLLGTNGRFTYIQDSKGGSKGMLYRTNAIDGKDLHLTILPELQERLEGVVDNVVYDSSIHGAVVVLNPRTGALLAMKSFPGFDLNYLARGMPEDEWEQMQKDPNIPLYNRATQGLYTPGSVFKTMTSAALIETGTMRPTDQMALGEQDRIHQDQWNPSDAFMNSMQERKDMGSWKEQSNPGGDRARPIKRTANTGRHTPMNMLNSIIDSDNIFFAYGAMRMGWTKLEKFCTKVGWTEPLELERQYGIEDENYGDGRDKQLETSTPQLYDVTKNQNDYDLAVTGYGQGQIMVSPLQMAVFVSAYANGGVAMQPYVVDSIWHADGTDYTLVEQRKPKVWKRLFEESTVNSLLPALRLVTVEGTAKNLTSSFLTRAPFRLGYTFAGKTGTAEISDDKTKELAWFICWRDTYSGGERNGQPVDDEDARLICVMLEVNLPMGMEWNQMKYDIARELMKDYVMNK